MRPGTEVRSEGIPGFGIKSPGANQWDGLHCHTFTELSQYKFEALSAIIAELFRCSCCAFPAPKRVSSMNCQDCTNDNDGAGEHSRTKCIAAAA